MNGFYPEFNSGNQTQITFKRANWVLVSTPNGSVHAKAVINGCSDSHFGDKWHLLRLLSERQISCEEFTPNGIGFMRGLYCEINSRRFKL